MRWRKECKINCDELKWKIAVIILIIIEWKKLTNIFWVFVNKNFERVKLRNKIKDKNNTIKSNKIPHDYVLTCRLIINTN